MSWGVNRLVGGKNIPMIYVFTFNWTNGPKNFIQMSSVVSVLAQANRAKSRVRSTLHIIRFSRKGFALDLVFKLLDICKGFLFWECQFHLNLLILFEEFFILFEGICLLLLLGMFVLGVSLSLGWPWKVFVECCLASDDSVHASQS